MVVVKGKSESHSKRLLMTAPMVSFNEFCGFLWPCPAKTYQPLWKHYQSIHTFKLSNNCWKKEHKRLPGICSLSSLRGFNSKIFVYYSLFNVRLKKDGVFLPLFWPSKHPRNFEQYWLQLCKLSEKLGLDCFPLCNIYLYCRYWVSGGTPWEQKKSSSTTNWPTRSKMRILR